LQKKQIGNQEFMTIDKKSALVGAGAAIVVLIVAFAVYIAWFAGDAPSETAGARAASETDTSHAKAPSRASAASAQSLELSPQEFEKFKVEPVQEHDFKIQREAVGNIDFNQEMSVQVFAPFPGRLISLFAKAGDDVQKGGTLFTIDSPDLLEAESSLISTAGTLNVTTRALQRAKDLYEVQGVSQKDLDQAVADQQAAEGALRAVRDALRIFGKTDAEMDRIVAQRSVDSVLAVHSPIMGRITARNAAPGLFVQPGSAPAPYTVSDISTVWMLANVPETDFPFLQLGEEVAVDVKAYPGRIFRGTIVNIGASVDLSTRRVLVRSEIRDPKHELRPGMFATFVIRTSKTTRSPAVPFSGVVREGDGTMTVWVTADGKRLVKRTVKVGLQQEGLHQIVEGLKPGELVATDGALFLNNALTAASR
jgi:cobalt-zinc-cadmium efflux system membrane fusion protein